MKKKLITAIVFAGIFLAGNVAKAQVKFFQGTWARAVAEAKKQNKPIFVDAYTTWCGPCKWMNAQVFTDKKVGEFYNANFINYRIDTEKGEGVTFAKNHGVKAFPTLIFFDKNEKEIKRIIGAKPADQFINAGKKAAAMAK